MESAIRQFGERAKAIRIATGLTQEDFMARLRAASEAVLGQGTRKYSQSKLSRLETGSQSPDLEDVAVLAACDPEGRGLEWLGWGVAPALERRDSAAPHFKSRPPHEEPEDTRGSKAS